MSDETANVRYMVDDVEAAIDFYTDTSASRSARAWRPRSPTSGAGAAAAAQRAGELRRAADARRPPAGPGGWNRIHLIVDDIQAEVERLRAEGLTFRNDVIKGPGGMQILLDDPSGNPIELFQPR
jgi:catechol 2,3-dioxygenase-like lactoylglutathione lyase family enzyme